MTKVYPTPITSVVVSPPKSSAASKNPVVFTVWKKSLLFNYDGFPVFDSNGNLVFRVDNYVTGGNGEIVLMDAFGRSVVTIGRKRISLSDTWQVHDGETTLVPRFSVTKHMNIFNTKSLAYVCKEGSSKNNDTRIPMYEIDGSYAQRCCIVYDDMRRNVAEIRSKEAKGGTVALGVDVFRLVMQPSIDPAVAMALIVVLDQMFGSSRRVF
ncbi:protein LURP-one-related 8-like [Cynara cardunculus var. scolymus]|uniref:LURP1-like domain-containing protein n=1 Tax=Cynara cardunculus var. scolymus TaxID=59895 RepID=A0A103D5K5_CYNCS|nr:protein LURP-one-related 8-like [Cynara cardunculus var. scolymus]KVD98177.1 LURP1-like domain-containing protein [Cynara cardunculus var. scolymus]